MYMDYIFGFPLLKKGYTMYKSEEKSKEKDDRKREEKVFLDGLLYLNLTYNLRSKNGQSKGL